MKKRLEAELISIAHRILKLKNQSELTQLHLETQKLYETLSVLKFVEQNMNIIVPKIDVVDVEQKLEATFINNENLAASANEENAENTTTVEKNQEIVTDIEIPVQEINDDESTEIEQDLIEVENDKIEVATINFEPEPIVEPEKEVEITEQKNAVPREVSFDEFIYEEPIFEKKSEDKPQKSTNLNEKLTSGINIGLNDRVAFVKHLFDDKNEDYIRVLSQINTFDNYLETVNFINDFVKPDYNNWTDKDEYVMRFLEAVERKFV